MNKKILGFLILCWAAIISCTKIIKNSSEESSITGVIDTINPNSVIVLEYDSFPHYSLFPDYYTYKYNNLVLHYDKICYKDSTHLFDFAHKWNRRGSEEIKVWSNGLRTTIIIPLDDRNVSMLILQYKGTELIQSIESPHRFHFLNDIDGDCFAEVGDYNFITGEPIWVDDTIECALQGEQLRIYRITDDSLVLDSSLTARATSLEYTYLKDTVILQKNVAIVRVNQIDLANHTLQELESE